MNKTELQQKIVHVSQTIKQLEERIDFLLDLIDRLKQENSDLREELLKCRTLSH